MTKWSSLLAALCVLAGLPGARAATPAPTELEKTVFLSMALDSDYSKSQIATRILGQQFAQDDSVCDVVAEKLLNETVEPTSALVVNTIQWYIVTIREACSGRYHDALTTLRGRFTNPKILKHIDAALAVPVDITVPQYKPGGVDLLTLQIDLLQELGKLHGVGSAARGAVPGMTFGEVLDRAGMPEDLAQINYTIARYGHSNGLAAYYRYGGLLIFRRDYHRKKWVVGERLDELASVSQTYKGKYFAIAQSVACLRGRVFREYIRSHGRQIRAETALLWALTNRLTQAPFPSDKFEANGLVVGVRIVAGSGNPEALQMLTQIGGAPGDEVPAEARVYAQKLRNRALPVEEPAEPADADAADEPPVPPAKT